MYAEERQQAMARLAGEHGRLSVAALAEEFGVTTETVRRDLAALERIGLVRRVHGGAVPAGSLAALAPEGAPTQVDAAEQQLIARAALAQLPAAGATVLLDAGATTTRLAGLLPRDHRLTVVTPAVPIAARLAGLPHIDLHLLPGRVDATTRSAIGADTVGALEQLRVDVAFVDPSGITLEHGLSTPDHERAATKRAMVSAARRAVCVTESVKVGTDTPVRFARLDEIDVLVTDTGLPKPARAAFARAGLEVVLA